jgi:hypothetical protein
MKRLSLAFVLAVAVGAAACSADVATSHVGTRDAPVIKACDDVRLLTQTYASLTPRDLLSRVNQVYNDASSSANPIIQARAVALYTDAEQMAEGGGPGSSFRGDLAAMQQACTSQS